MTRRGAYESDQAKNRRLQHCLLLGFISEQNKTSESLTHWDFIDHVYLERVCVHVWTPEHTWERWFSPSTMGILGIASSLSGLAEGTFSSLRHLLHSKDKLNNIYAREKTLQGYKTMGGSGGSGGGGGGGSSFYFPFVF